MGAGVGEAVLTLNLPTTVPATGGETGIGPGIRSGTPSGDSCTGNKLTFIE